MGISSHSAHSKWFIHIINHSDPIIILLVLFFLANTLAIACNSVYLGPFPFSLAWTNRYYVSSHGDEFSSLLSFIFTPEKVCST